MNAPAQGFRLHQEPRNTAFHGEELLILSAYFHPEPTGSAPPITDLAFWLAEQGVGTRVATARPSYPKREVFEGYRHGERDHERLNGVDTLRVAAFVAPTASLAGRLRTELSVAGRLIAARLRGDIAASPNVVCVCPSTFVVAAAPLFRRRGGRVLCIVHDLQSGLAKSLGFGLGGILLRGLRSLERWAFNRCDVLVALTEEMAEELRALGVRRPIAVIPPQVDISEIEPRAEAPGPLTLLYSGNLGRKQGLDQVLELAAVLKRRGAPVRILIRGEGSERADLEAKAREADLTNVEFRDLAARDRLNEALAEGAVHLAPQNPDGATFALPSKIFSIMSAQRPFIATARPGSPLYRLTQESGAGLCTAPYDAEAFADAVEALASDPARRRRVGAAGRAYVERYVDREVVCRAIWSAMVKTPTQDDEPLETAAQEVAALRLLMPANSNSAEDRPGRTAAGSLAIEPRSFDAMTSDVDEGAVDDRPARRAEGAPGANIRP